MRGSIVDHDTKPRDRKPDQPALRYHRFEALLDRANELFGNRTAIDLIDELEVSFLYWLDIPSDTAVLSRTAGLLFVRVVELRLARDCFAVGDLRSSCF